VGGALRNDAALHRLGGQCRMGPARDGQAAVAGRLTRQRNDRADLLGRERWRRPRPRQIRQAFVERPALIVPVTVYSITAVRES
jgi:hypothetical protein